MNAIEHLADLQNVAPHEPTILVRINPANLSQTDLVLLQTVSEPTGAASDCLRLQLSAWLAAETSRRMSTEATEPAAWVLNWHKLDDDQLRVSLAASFSWLQLDVQGEALAALIEIHRAVVTAACARLGELHEAIQRNYEN